MAGQKRVYRPGARVVATEQTPYQLKGYKPDEWLAVHPGDRGEVVQGVPGTGSYWVYQFATRHRVLVDAGRMRPDPEAPR